VVSIISACIAAWSSSEPVADGIQNAFEIDTWKSGIVVSLIFGAIVFGVKESPNSICRSHNGHYLYCNCIGDHSDRYRSTSWSYRFSFLKVLLTWKLVLEPFWFSSSMGCKRGIYSNEAGQGTAPHIAANVSHPTKG
jgi:AGCS family alanine or glycine:cation symporter